MRSVRIVSDGTPKGTNIFDAATGERVDGVQSVRLELSLRGTKMRAYLEEKVRVDQVLVTDADVVAPKRLCDDYECCGGQ